MKNFFIIISTLTLVCCNTAQDYSKEISMLDSLHVLITQIEPEFIGIDKKKLNPRWIV
ncbi:MAG: hypothetical protein SH856_13610 [Flavobacteriales bacterium]|nr:hypothetical protein [Flavobacteriales bacterium]